MASPERSTKFSNILFDMAHLLYYFSETLEVGIVMQNT